MSYSITRWFEIDAGHRVPLHESKCKNLHGHRYKIGVTVSSGRLDPVGRVLDYGRMKEIFGSWLEEEWDHGMILQARDEWVQILTEAGTPTKLYLMEGPPTAECMARLLHQVFTALLSSRGYNTQQISKVVVFETPNCSASWPSE